MGCKAFPCAVLRLKSLGPPGAVTLKERTMSNSRPNVQLFGYPVTLRSEQDVPGFRVKPPEEEVPGFHLNPDGSRRSLA